MGLAAAILLAGCLSTTEAGTVEPIGEPPPVLSIVTPPEPVPKRLKQPESPFDELAQPMFFEDGCEDADSRTVLAFVGDVLLHRRLQRQASRTRARYNDLFREDIATAIQVSDIAYANLEGPVALGINGEGEEVEDPGMKFDGTVYTSYPRFNYHPKIAEALATLGVDVVSTANNHSMDRNAIGVDRTIDALDKRGLKHFGTRKQKPRHLPFYTTTTLGDFKIGWVACTYGFSGAADRKHQVRQCGREESRIVADIQELSQTMDAVIVTPHWGKEYESLPREEERAAARRMLDAGAVAVVGSHPHVLQPWEKYRAGDRDTFILHSLGNFVSNQRDVERRSSIVLYLELSKFGNAVKLTGAQYLPIHTAIAEDHHMYVEPADKERDPEAWGHVVGTMGDSNRMGNFAQPPKFRSSCR